MIAAWNDGLGSIVFVNGCIVVLGFGFGFRSWHRSSPLGLTLETDELVALMPG